MEKKGDTIHGECNYYGNNYSADVLDGGVCEMILSQYILDDILPKMYGKNDKKITFIKDTDNHVINLGSYSPISNKQIHKHISENGHNIQLNNPGKNSPKSDKESKRKITYTNCFQVPPNINSFYLYLLEFNQQVVKIKVGVLFPYEVNIQYLFNFCHREKRAVGLWYLGCKDKITLNEYDLNIVKGCNIKIFSYLYPNYSFNYNNPKSKGYYVCFIKDNEIDINGMYNYLNDNTKKIKLSEYIKCGYNPVGMLVNRSYGSDDMKEYLLLF